MISDNQPCVILVNPQLAVNIGMSARAMMNCGLYQMRLVAPREDHLSERAVSAASGAEKILFDAKVYATTAEAVADLEKIFATTARRRDMIKIVNTAEAAAAKITSGLNDNIRCGILFGPERTGLHNDDIVLSDEIIEIPLNPEHCSLNLSQAVLLVGYELYKKQISVPETQLITNKTKPAPKEQLARFFAYLETELEEHHTFRSDEKKPHMIRNIRNIFQRMELTEQDISTLYGIINHLAGKSNRHK